VSSLRRTRLGTVVVAAAGIAVSAYLTWIHYSGSLALCVGVGGCETVQASRYADIGPLPVAALGLAGFIAIAAVAASRLRPDPPTWTLTALFTMALAGALYAAYLTYLELFVIGAVCPWCLTVALSSALVLILTTKELRAGWS
jgi:uncharacterized membrane protein